MTSPPARDRVGPAAPSRKEAESTPGVRTLGSEPSAPPTHLFTLIGYDELAQEDGQALGLSPPEGYHLEGWKLADEAVVVCWEHDEA